MSSVHRPAGPPPSIRQVAFRPPSGDAQPLEVLNFPTLLTRASAELLRCPERLGFWLVLGLTQGHCDHHVDYRVHRLHAGQWLVLAPGQVQAYDTSSHWDGVILVFRADFLPPASTMPEGARWSQDGLDLRPEITLPPTEHHASLQACAQLAADTATPLQQGLDHALIQYQLQALLMRLARARSHTAVQRGLPAGQWRRYSRFVELLESRFMQWHTVEPYAHALGCTARTLDRSCMDASGLSAKSLLTRRRVLEAQRLLAHTAMPIQVIGEQLGFSEATNFTKFFRQAVGHTPRMFRQTWMRETPTSQGQRPHESGRGRVTG